MQKFFDFSWEKILLFMANKMFIDLFIIKKNCLHNNRELKILAKYIKKNFYFKSLKVQP